MRISHKADTDDPEADGMAKPVGQVLRKLREATGMPRSEVARKAKPDPSVLWRLENPKEGVQPRFDLLSRVALTLGASLDDVVVRLEFAAARDDQATARELLDRIVDAVERLHSAQTGVGSPRESDGKRLSRRLPDGSLGVD